ncbi:MAG: adenylate/guanylate cyclase domain-containing protein, partial [Leptospiraceae bacterium]|nr:adenylate/guanylate cyclase domain-containing protein [Leptospiraceae bacterium]
IGKHKLAFDVWGDRVNTASRMASNGEIFKINCSKDTYELAKYFFEFEYRGKFEAKNKGFIDMYFLKGIRKDLSVDKEGKIPSGNFFNLYEQLKAGKRFRFRSEVR